MEQQSGLIAVRLIGPRATLERMAQAARSVRWAESRYDEEGRLVLPVPKNYVSDDFGRLLEAINPHTADFQGLQMIGPNGGVVDMDGVEHADD